MKTKWKKWWSIPLLLLLLNLTFIKPAKAMFWFTELTSVCDIQVQIQDSGGYWRWVTVEGIRKECIPALFSLCTWTGCAPLPYPER